MIPALALCMLLNTPAAALPAAEPDGSRTVGIVPPFHGRPEAPEWLRGASHAKAAVDTRHYLYEAYAGPDGQWLVRYVMLPEENEAFREIEQVFLFGDRPQRKGRLLKAGELAIEPNSAVWKGTAFTLVDRRDLQKP